MLKYTSQLYGSVVMTLEKHRYKSGDLCSTPGRDIIYYIFTYIFVW